MHRFGSVARPVKTEDRKGCASFILIGLKRKESPRIEIQTQGTRKLARLKIGEMRWTCFVSLDQHRPPVSGEPEAPHRRCMRSAFVACAAPVQASSLRLRSVVVWSFLSRVFGLLALLAAFVLY